MAKIALLVPHGEMEVLARETIEEEAFDSLRGEILSVKTIETTNAVAEARAATSAGAEILVMRGYQAILVKHYTNIPLVEMRLHAQEIGLLLKRAKEVTGRECPQVALVAFPNMVRDMSELERLFGVSLRIAYLSAREAVHDTLLMLEKEGTDLYIGGDAVCTEAEAMGLLALRYGSSKVAVREALYEAERMSYAMDSEKRNVAQLDALLGTTFHGIIKLNAQGSIIVMNRVVADLLGKDADAVKGLPVWEVFPDFEKKPLQRLLAGKNDIFTTTVWLKGQPWVLLGAPILYEGKGMGAFLSLEKIRPTLREEYKKQQENYRNGFVAECTFDRLHSENKQMQRQLEMARRFALSERPVLIYAPEGTEDAQLAEAIHNNGIRKSQAFIRVDAGAVRKGQQGMVLFGDSGEAFGEELDQRSALFHANQGTLFIQRAECLDLSSQGILARLLSGMGRVDFQGMGQVSVRFLLSTRVNLRLLVERGEFLPELYYRLQALTLEIPSLVSRPEDLHALFAKCFQKYSKTYGKYLVLTQGAKKELERFPWEGNGVQLEAFCERLVLSADHRSVDEVELRLLYEQLFPKIREEEEKKVVIYHAKEEEEIRELLTKYHGNRNQVAGELGISTTTLWRRMKKYGIRDFEE